MSLPLPSVSAETTTAAGDERTTFILQKRYNAVGCFVCKAKTHTHISCPSRPCYLCKQLGHLSHACPYRLKPGAHAAALRAAAASRRKARSLAAFLKDRESGAAARPADVFIRDAQFDSRAALALRRVHRKRITAAEWHPAGGHFITGDKAGIVRVWSVGDVQGGGRLGDHLPRGATSAEYVHHCNVTGFVWGRGSDVVYSSSADGMVHELRLELAGSAAAQEKLEKGVRDTAKVVDMNPEGWHGQSNYKMAYGMAMGIGGLYVGNSVGQVWRADPRGGKADRWRLHRDKVTCVDVNAVNPNLMATASNDRLVCLWDARRIGPGMALGWFKHGRVATSAFFSPNSGAKLLSTSIDNRIRLWGDVHGFVGDVNGREDVETVEIVHSHDFHRHLNPFRAVWDPKDWRDDLFMCGRMMGDAYFEEGGNGKELLLHPIDMFLASTGSAVHSLIDPAVTLICTTNKFSPVSDAVLTAASGDIVLWTPPPRGEARSRGVLGRRRGGGDESDGDDSDSDGDDADGADAAPRKKRKTAVVTKRKGRSTPKRKAASK